jgi:hypothetical protein
MPTSLLARRVALSLIDWKRKNEITTTNVNEIEHVDQRSATTMERRGGEMQNVQLARWSTGATCMPVSLFASIRYSSRRIFPSGDGHANNASQSVIKYHPTSESSGFMINKQIAHGRRRS